MAHKPLGFMQLTIICGFSLYYAWYLIAFFGLFMAVPDGGSFASFHTGQVIFFGGNIMAMIAILALFTKEGNVSSGRKRFLYLASLVPGTALPACFALMEMGIQVPLAVFYLACLLAGTSIAVGFMLWEDLTTHGYLNRGVLAHGIMFCAGGILFLASTTLLTILGSCIVAESLLCASTALLAFIVPRCDISEDKPIVPVQDYFRSTWNIDLVIAVMNAAFGFAFILFYWQDATTLLVAMGVAIIVDLVFAIAFGWGKWLQFAGAVRICSAMVSCAFLLLVCPGDLAHTVSLCIVVLFWFLFRTINGGSCTNLANQHGFSVLYTATRGKLPANVGFTLGLALGVWALQLGIPNLTMLFIPLTMIALFILSALFLLPFDSESATAGYKSLAIVDMYESPELSFRRKCATVSSQYRLSPRESEVIEYLIRGRNAKHVAEKLYISESTAKTHISNIYRKVGVHSQQELLDALDNL